MYRARCRIVQDPSGSTWPASDLWPGECGLHPHGGDRKGTRRQSLILDEPIFLDARPVMNTTYRAPAAASLTMHGTTCPVAFTFVARFAGTSLEATGSIAVRFSEWNIRTPVGIKNTGAIEFVLRMGRSACGVSRRRCP